MAGELHVVFEWWVAGARTERPAIVEALPRPGELVRVVVSDGDLPEYEERSVVRVVHEFVETTVASTALLVPSKIRVVLA